MTSKEWSMTSKEGKSQKGLKKNRHNLTTKTKRVTESELGEKARDTGWTGGRVRHKNWCEFG